MPKHLATPRTSSPQMKNEPKNIGFDSQPDVSYLSSQTSGESTEAVTEVHADLTMVDNEPVIVASEVQEVAQRPSFKDKSKKKRIKKEKKPPASKKPKQPKQPKQSKRSKQQSKSGSRGVSLSTGRLDFQGFMDNLAPVDIVAILGFAFLAGWTLWFSIECFMMPVIFPAIVSLIASIVFAVCFVLLVRARMVGPYSAQEKVDALYEAPCSIRVIDGFADDKDSDVKACTVTCTRENLILNFKVWQNVVPWNEVEVVDSVGARGLTLKIPRDKVRIVVRMTFSTTEDRFAIEQICQKYSQKGKDVLENADI